MKKQPKLISLEYLLDLVKKQEEKEKKNNVYFLNTNTPMPFQNPS